jgi:hypothetical protein
MRLQILILLTIIISTSCTLTNKREKLTMTELDTISYQDLLDKSFDYLNVQQEICKEKYKISTYKNWFYDQETGELTFSDNGIKKLIIKYENVGTVSLKSNTWLWAWANNNTLDKVKSKIGIVKTYGSKREFEKLMTSKWAADEVDGWEMTSIAAYLMNAKGAYRVKSSDDSVFVFMIFKEVQWADSLASKRK